jgi:hypothetical protein
MKKILNKIKEKIKKVTKKKEKQDKGYVSWNEFSKQQHE